MAFNPIDDTTGEYGDLVSVETFAAIADAVNYLIDSMPVGSIVPIFVGFPGVPTPDPAFWQECDGSIVTNGNSPLFGEAVPDHTDGRYLKGASTIGEVGNFGGSLTKNLAHDHGGRTDVKEFERRSDSDDDGWNVRDHDHSVPSDMGEIEFEPAHIRIKHYIKIL